MTDLATRRILVVDDAEGQRELISGALRARGFVVQELVDGPSLIAWACARAQGSPTCFAADVVVTDVHMPGASGLEALRELRRLGVQVPVVLVSAFFDDGIRAEARSLRAAAVLDKPLDLELLRRTVIEQV